MEEGAGGVGDRKEIVCALDTKKVRTVPSRGRPRADTHTHTDGRVIMFRSGPLSATSMLRQYPYAALALQGDSIKTCREAMHEGSAGYLCRFGGEQYVWVCVTNVRLNAGAHDKYKTRARVHQRRDVRVHCKLWMRDREYTREDEKYKTSG